MPTNDTTKKNKVYVPLFIRDIPEETQYFFPEEAFKINKSRETLYVNLLGYAALEQSAYFCISGHKEDGQLVLDDEVIVADVVSSRPDGIDWYEMPIEAINADKLFEARKKNQSEAVILHERWQNYSAEQSVDAISIYLASLERTKTTEDGLGNLDIVKAMKRVVLLKIQRTNDYLDLEGVFGIVDDVLDDDDEKAKKSEDFIAIFEKIRKVADAKLEVLSRKGGVKPAALIPLEDISFEELENCIHQYSAEVLEAFLKLTEDAGFSDFEKASLVRDYINSSNK